MVNNSDTQYYIPMEINTKSDMAFATAHGYSSHDICNRKIGNIVKRVILIPCTKEEYYEYMRSEWTQQKREQRKKAYFEEHGIQSVSVEYISEMYELDIIDPCSTEEQHEKQEILIQLKELLNQLETLDKRIMQMYLDGYSEAAIGKEIGMSQKGVNKRKQKVFKDLRLHFLD